MSSSRCCLVSSPPSVIHCGQGFYVPSPLPLLLHILIQILLILLIQSPVRLFCLCVFCFCRVCYGGNDGGGVAHDGAMVGCEILNEASNGTTWWGAGMDRLDRPRPPSLWERPHTLILCVNNYHHYFPHYCVEDDYCAGWRWSWQGSNLLPETLGLSKILLLLEALPSLKKGVEIYFTRF